VTVKANSRVEGGEVFAKASTSINDIKSKVHVHLQVKIMDKFVDPTLVYGAYLDSLTDLK
jgi:hypothetical protein